MVRSRRMVNFSYSSFNPTFSIIERRINPNFSIKGSVVKIMLRRENGTGLRHSCSQPEHLGNHPVSGDNVSLGRSMELFLTNYVHDLITSQGPPGGIKGPESQTRFHPPFNKAMVVLTGLWAFLINQ